jgi:lysophospholipase L1-like esterase
VNAGVWGYDTPQELAFLRGGAAGYRPQIVVVGLTTPVTPTRNWYCHERGVITLEPLLSDATGVFGSMAAFLKNNSHVYSFLERRVRFRGSLLPAGWRLPGFGASDAAVPAPSMPLDESAALTAGLVGELRDEAQRGGAALAVVIFPSLDQVLELAAEPQPEPSRERILREDLVRRLRASGIPSLDLTEPLAAEPDREGLFLPRDPVHPSRRGHARSADAARAFLAATHPGLF